MKTEYLSEESERWTASEEKNCRKRTLSPKGRRLFAAGALFAAAVCMLPVSDAVSNGLFGMCAEAEEVVPSSCDPRPDGITAIRDQHPWGTCWDFGGIAGFESFLVKNGLADASLDLSEEDVIWWASGCQADVTTSGYGWSRTARNDGGFSAMVTGYLMSVGGRTEADIPYFNNPAEPDMEEFLCYGTDQWPAAYQTAASCYEVTDITYLTNPDAETIKKTILECGAVTCAYYDDHLDDDGDPSYFNAQTSAYWYPSFGSSEDCNHTIAVVGWNDSYSKENFTAIDGQLPQNDGAWLIKNSYGSDFGSEGGYIWISYEDKLLFHTDGEEDYDFIYAVSGARTPSGMKQYAYDEYGAVTIWTLDAGSEAVFANVFDFGAGEKLSEVTLMTMSEGDSYELYYAPVTEDVPSSDSSSWTLLSSGTVQHAGYMTVDLENKINLPQGKGAILLRLSGDTAFSIGVEEDMLRYMRPLFSARLSNMSWYLKDGSFTKAVRTKSNGDFSYESNFDLSLRVKVTVSE